MTKKVLVLSGDSLEHFFLATDTGMLTFGEPPDHAEVVLRGLRVTGIRCEVEADDDVSWRDEAQTTGQPMEQPLAEGEEVTLGPLHMRLMPVDAAVVVAEEESLAPPQPASDGPGLDLFDVPGSSAPPKPVRLRLRVVDGADKGQTFLLPEKGNVIIGNSTNKAAGIVLHDLWVSPSHSRLDVDGDQMTVTHLDGKTPTRINGQPIPGPHLLTREEVLRVGNSHMQLEPVPVEDLAPPAAGDEVWPDEVQSSRHVHQKEVETAKPAAPPAPSAPPSPWPPKEGQCIGHYKLGELLGEGHSGQAFRAEETKTGTVVTLKVLAPEFPKGNEELQQFARVLKAAPHLAHPHLVTLHGAGKTGSLCWIAREHVEGESAASHIERIAEGGKASWTRAARVAIHLARALRFLHKHKVAHGNITPKNVLLRAGDKQTKLADLMLMKALNGSQLQHDFVNKKLLDEVAYLAPEQARPGALGDEASDLYSVGAVVYALATGHAPFIGDTLEEIVEQVAHKTVPRPTKFQKGIPSEFEAVLLKLLSKRQEDRYASAEQLLSDLEHLAVEHAIKL